MIRVIGNRAWRSLQSLKAPITAIEDCGNIRPYDLGRPIIESPVVVINNCNKNFIYYWMKPSILTKVQTIYLGSHPCELAVLQRFSPETEILISDRFSRYGRWGTNSVVISQSCIDRLLATGTVSRNEALYRLKPLER